MSSKRKTCTAEEKKVMTALLQENQNFMNARKLRKSFDRTKLDDLTNQWRKLKGVGPLQPKLVPPPEKKDEKKDKIDSAPPAAAAVVDEPVMVESVPEETYKIPKFTRQLSEGDSSKKKKLVIVPKRNTVDKGDRKSSFPKAIKVKEPNDSPILVAKPSPTDHKENDSQKGTLGWFMWNKN